MYFHTLDHHLSTIDSFCSAFAFDWLPARNPLMLHCCLLAPFAYGQPREFKEVDAELFARAAFDDRYFDGKDVLQPEDLGLPASDVHDPTAGVVEQRLREASSALLAFVQKMPL